MKAGLKSASRWLHPGLGFKRWLIPLLLGITILGLGIGLFLRELYAESAYPAFLRVLLLQDWPRWSRAVIFGLIGAGLVGFSIFQLNKTLLAAFLPEEATVGYIAERVYRHRGRQRRGPKVVAIGGGTGLSVLLSGLKHHTENITAIVTVADDGGSSGKLRRDLGVLPPGDFRSCIASLADDEALTTQLFQYRFRSGQGLEGHSFGNLFITAMAEVTGSFEKALYESGRVLNIRGIILPSTLENVTLFAEVKEGCQTRKVEGESAIPEAKLPIERVYLQPDTPPPFPPTIQAILNADLIVLGPGSLYTSLIPNLLVADIVTAIRASAALKVYVCNVATQPGETGDYSVDDHMKAIENHTRMALDDLSSLVEEEKTAALLLEEVGSPQYQAKSRCLFKFVLANSNLTNPIPASRNLQPVLPSARKIRGCSLIEADVIDDQRPWRHDPIKLANELMDWYKHQKKQSHS